MTAPAPQLRLLPSSPLVVVRQRVHASELSRVVPECCGLVWNALRRQQLNPGRHVAIYWNADIRLEVGVECAESFIEDEGLVRSSTPEGPAVVATHWGPYFELGRTHETIQRWCEARGHSLAGPNWEIYGHWQPEWDTRPSEIRTEVFYQVASQ